MPEPITMVAVGSGIIGLGAHLARRYFEVAKEVFDIVLGTFALILAMPVMLACVAIIKLSSRGPAFFTQVRVGQGGRSFTMYKLRTMRTDAETGSGAVWAEDDDPRIIPWCRWMRHSHVDELPQLINVIKGDMSLVGPRPERPEIMVELKKAYPRVHERLAVRPGITGLAQIRNGYDTSVDAFRHKLESDIEYIEGLKWRNELRILFATLAKFRDNQAK